jgi:DNA polymerase-3 subunit delta'
VLLLVSDSPNRLLATIRSRCRRLPLRPLSTNDVARAVSAAIERRADDPDVIEAAAASDGSVARALMLLGGSAVALRRQVLDLLGQLPNPDARAIHALGDALGGTDPQTLAAFVDTVNGWLSARLVGNAVDVRQSARVAEIWQQVNDSAREVETFNLDRRPLVFATFSLLAEAARG